MTLPDHLRAAVDESKTRVAALHAELTRWDQIGLLTVTIDRLEKWYLPGLLCIGDAAHAMSPAA